MIVAKLPSIPLLLRHIGPELLILLIYDTSITVAYVVGGMKWVAISELPITLFGTAIGLMLTLRNNAAYGRWWEARTLWGAVVNHSRSFTRSVLAMVDDRSEQQALIRLQIAYVHALRLHLLKADPEDTVAPLLPAEVWNRARAAANRPAALQMIMADDLHAAARRGLIDSIRLAALNTVLSDLANAQGGLERIRNTPLPRHYAQLPRVFTLVYCLLLPLGLVADLHALTPIGSTIVSFMFLALGRTGQDLEEPMTGSVHDVPMRNITTVIETDLLNAIGDADLPRPVVAKNGVLP